MQDADEEDGVDIVVDTGETMSLLSYEASGVVVTSTVSHVVAQPTWHDPQGPIVVVVLVVGQHGSLGGT